ncbi:MAG TPA: hypothetical protein VFX58_03195 [Chitinophagaceae bacterium]|jgi:hypothetical protein|nr:hypothetical protein [Chitinophagaceae bacterium]
MRLSSVLFAAIFMMLVLSGCGVVETIFKAGMAWAFILIGLVVFIVIFIAMKARRK